MAAFKRNTQTSVNNVDNLKEASLDMKVQAESSIPLDLNQLEDSIHELAKKVMQEKAKNAHLIETQKQRLEQLNAEMERTTQSRNEAMSPGAPGIPKDPEVYREDVKKAQALSEQLIEQKTRIERLQFDIQLLEQEKDVESINILLEKWDLYETEIFKKYITPMQQKVLDSKQKYYENLKQLRSHYAGIEKLAVHINHILILEYGKKLEVHNWFEAVQKNPELQITKQDEQKEDAIINTYRAE